MLICALLSTGLMASEMTGAGTCMELIDQLRALLQKVSPEAQSMPNRATMSPEPASSISSISSACMRTSRPTLAFLPVRLLMMVSPFLISPW